MKRKVKARKTQQTYYVIDSSRTILHTAKGRKRALDWASENVPNDVFGW